VDGVEGKLSSVYRPLSAQLSTPLSALSVTADSQIAADRPMHEISHTTNGSVAYSFAIGLLLSVVWNITGSQMIRPTM